MPNIIDVVASRVSRDLTRQKLTNTFKAQPITAKGIVLGKQLAMINGTPTTTTLDDADLAQTIVEFSNIGRPIMAVWAASTTSGAAQASSASGTNVSSSTPSVPTTRRINTVAPILGGGDLSADLTLSLASNSVTAEALAAVIVPSTTIDTEVIDGKLQLTVIPQTVDADTLDGYHAADLMPPAGTITGDFLRWNNTTEAWEVEHEPIAVAGLVMTPQASMTAAEGTIYYDATSKHLMVYTEA